MRRFKGIALAGLVLASFSLAIAGTWAQTIDSTSAAPPPQGEEAEQAALDFVTWCGPCHGRLGRGDGPVAPSLKAVPPDLTRLSERTGGTFPTDMVRQRIDGRDLPTVHGTAEMPIWGSVFTLQATAAGMLQEDREGAENEVKRRISRLVQYLETLQQ